MHPDEQVVVRHLSANFREFPQLSANFRNFPQLSATFRTLHWRSRKISGNFLQIFRVVLQILEMQCALHGRGRTAQWSLWCTVAAHQVKGVVVVLMSGPWGDFHSDKADC